MLKTETRIGVQRPPAEAPSLEAVDVTRRFGETVALDGVSLALRRGQVHALLGPNGAGKTTLLRILSGLLEQSGGEIRLGGAVVRGGPRALRRRIGLVPSGDRSFYLRISGLENLVFFARLHGLGRRAALARSHELLEQVGLAEAARRPVGVYSHGMQKRLGVARALLTRPPVLLVDEATHDLDPEGAIRVRELVAAAGADGAAVLWTTQRLDEIRAFADTVTLLQKGRARFAGSVDELLVHSLPRRFVVRVRDALDGAPAPVARLQRALGVLAAAESDGSEHATIELADGAVLGDALAALAAARVHVLSCRQERSEIEEAFLSLTREAEL
jgi:ABC-2 type transport system ATP-binding protein